MKIQFFEEVVEYGDLTNIKWFFENGCPYSRHNIKIHFCKEDVKIWIRENLLYEGNYQ